MEPYGIIVFSEDLKVSTLIQNVASEINCQIIYAFSVADNICKQISSLQTKPDIVIIDVNTYTEEQINQCIKQIDFPLVLLSKKQFKTHSINVKQPLNYIYLLIPFSLQEFKMALDTAIYKHTTDKQLAEQEKKHNDLFNSFFNIRIEIDLLGKITNVSPSVYAILGYEPNQILNTPLAAYFKDRNQYSILIATIHQTKECSDVEIHLLHKNGVSVAFSLYLKFNHTNTGFIVIAKDTSQLKNHISKLTYHQKKLKEAQHLAKVVTWRFNLKTKELEFSEDFYALFEIPYLKKITVYDLLKYIHPNDVSHVKLTVTTLAEEKEKSIFFRIITPQKKTKWIYAKNAYNTGFYKDSLYLYGILQDVTEYKSIQNSSNYLEKLIEHSGDLIFMADCNYNIIYINNMYALKHGYNKEELIGKTPEILRSGLMQKSFYQEAAEALTIGKNFEGIFINKKKNGKFIYLNQSITPVTEDGNLLYILVVAKDITAKKKIERKIKLLNYYLGIQSTENKKEVLQNFIQGQEEERKRIAQELHDGLGQILAMAKLTLPTSVSDKHIALQITQANTLIEKAVQEAKRIAAALLPPTLNDLGLAVALKYLIQQVSQSTHIPISLVIQNNFTILNKNKELAIYRIVQECLSNAVKHANCNHIVVKVSYINHCLTVKVIDDGIGISPDNLNKWDKQGYTGMGLSSIKERASTINAELLIKSLERKHTAIILKVPISPIYN